MKRNMVFDIGHDSMTQIFHCAEHNNTLTVESNRPINVRFRCHCMTWWWGMKAWWSRRNTA